MTDSIRDTENLTDDNVNQVMSNTTNIKIDS